MASYVPNLSAERVERLRRWHEEASAELHRLGAHEVAYLGLDLRVPEHVFPPTPVSDLLGREVRARVRPGDRVLDMGCGAGANAILAAQVTDQVVAVDVNPHAVDATAANAARNGVAGRVECIESDVFEAVDGEFDLIVIDPPFRWFEPHDLLERAMADEGYEALGRFITETSDRLRPGGSVLLFFGTSGDVEHLDALLARAHLTSITVAQRTVQARGEDVSYFVRRISGGRPTTTSTREQHDAMTLPPIIEQYQQAHDRGDTTAALATLAPDATVVDDGRRAEGHDQIAAWLTDTATAFTYARTLLSAAADGPTTWLVSNRLDGTFPGGTVDLRYRFTIVDDLIAELLIAP